MNSWIMNSSPAYSFNNLQMKNIDISVLIKYINGQIEGKEKREIELFLHKNPNYQKILKGLEMMKKNLKEGEDIEQYIGRKKEKLRRKIFKK